MWKSKFRDMVNEKANRDQVAYTQKHISEVTGIRQPTISAWMQYGATFSYLESSVVGALARFLGCSPLDMVEYVYEDETVAV